MRGKIEYIVNEKGEKIKAVIPLDMLENLLSGKSSKTNKMSKKDIKKYEGVIKLTVDPLKYQKDIRDEWR